jgi:cell division protease FtsH
MSTPTSPRPLASVAAAHAPALAPEVARALSTLANLIDRGIEERGISGGIPAFAARRLGLDPASIVETSVGASGVAYQCLAVALASTLDRHPPDAVIGVDEDLGPEYESMDLGTGGPVRLPVALAASWSSLHPVGCSAVVSVLYRYGRGMVFSVWTAADGVAEAERFLADLTTRGRGPLNPFRGRMLRASQVGHVGVLFSNATCPATTRADVILPDLLWEQIDRNVVGLFAAHHLLAASGLAVNRGLLLAGPPGTGKTAVCRALAHELVGGVTVVFADAAALSHSVVALYEEVAHLSPALVVLEDIDLVVGRRELQGNPEALQDFLVTLDGGMSDQRGIVTLATTNAPEAIDPAARRAARFDATIEVPAPPPEGRARIIGHFAAALGTVEEHQLDVERLARATDGYTGAELRELMSRAVIVVAHGRRDGTRTVLTTDLVLELVADRRAVDLPGQYL